MGKAPLRTVSRQILFESNFLWGKNTFRGEQQLIIKLSYFALLQINSIK